MAICPGTTAAAGAADSLLRVLASHGSGSCVSWRWLSFNRRGFGGFRLSGRAGLRRLRLRTLNWRRLAHRHLCGRFGRGGPRGVVIAVQMVDVHHQRDRDDRESIRPHPR